MTRGRRPLPSAVKEARGTDQPSRRNPREPKPNIGRPKCPRYLDTYAKKEWRRVVPELDAMGVLAVIDGATLEGYCVAHAMAVRMEIDVQANGVSDENGRKRAEANMWKDALTQKRMYAVELGLSPAARSKLQVTPTTPGTDDDDDDELFGDGPQMVK